MLRRLLLMFCAACLVGGLGAAIGGNAQVANNLCPGPTPTPTSTSTSTSTPTPTPTPSPLPSPSSCPSPTPDTAPPICKLTAIFIGPPKSQTVTVQDTGSGLAAITNIQVVNGTVTVPQFTPGTTQPIIVTATKTNQSNPTIWSFDAVDVASNVRHCS